MGIHLAYNIRTLKIKLKKNCVLSSIEFAFFSNVLLRQKTELLLVQKQTIHQQKARDLSYLEPEGQGHGMIRERHTHLPQKHIEKKANLTELSQDAKKIIQI